MTPKFEKLGNWPFELWSA